MTSQCTGEKWYSMRTGRTPGGFINLSDKDIDSHICCHCKKNK